MPQIPEILNHSATPHLQVLDWLIFIMKTLLPCITLLLITPLSGCLTNPNNGLTTSPSSKANPASAPSSVSISTPTKAELEAQRRADLSKNDSKVTFRTTCEGLFIPDVKRTVFQGVIPVYSIFVLNNSTFRYSVKYDVTLLERTRNVITNSSSEFTEEKSFIIRPGSYSKFDIAQQNHAGGRVIAEVKRVVVLSCDKT